MTGLLHFSLARINLIWSLAKNDFKSRFANSQLGIFWAFCKPIVMALVYIFVFTIVARAGQTDNGYPYALWLLPGLIVWFFMSEAISTGTTVLAEYSYLVKKVRFDISVLPSIKVTSALITHGVFVLLILFFYLIWGKAPSYHFVQMIYYTGCSLFLLQGISRLTCAIYPFFKDMGSIVEIVLMVVMWATPVMWDIKILPEQLGFLFALSPFAYLVTGYRDCFMGTAWIWEHPWPTISFWCIAILIHLGSQVVFKRLQDHFADII